MELEKNSENQACCLESFWACDWQWGRVISLVAQESFIKQVFPNVKVAAVHLNGEWNWPNPRSDYMVKIQSAICGTIAPSAANDKEVYRKLTPREKFTYRSLWDSSRLKNSRIDRYYLLWSALHIPRQSFIAWLAILDRLSTKARQVKMGKTILYVFSAVR